jgi:hypothetical protein
MANYLFSDRPGFHGAAWVATLCWLLILAAGIYLYSVWQERNPVRYRFNQRLGIGLMAVGGVGLVLMALKALGMPILSWRIWIYIDVLATIAVLGWAAWFYTQRLPRLLTTSSRAGAAVGARGARGARTYSANGTRPAEARPVQPPRPVATTGRREARRDKKRKSR